MWAAPARAEVGQAGLLQGVHVEAPRLPARGEVDRAAVPGRIERPLIQVRPVRPLHQAARRPLLGEDLWTPMPVGGEDQPLHGDIVGGDEEERDRPLLPEASRQPLVPPPRPHSCGRVTPAAQPC